MRVSTLVIVFCISVVFAALVALGTWQVQRLAWKESLIERVERYLAADPQSAEAILQETENEPANIDYRPVVINGTYVSDQAVFEFTTHNGQSGWNQFALLQLEQTQPHSNVKYAFINRGFIPFEAKNSWQSVAQVPVGTQTITGLMRVAPTSKPGSFMPDNLPSEYTYYWRDLVSMAGSIRVASAEVASWYVDEGIPGKMHGQLGKYPISGTTIISFSNNHLQYVVTWYGLALALLGVGGYFLYARHETKDRPER